MAKSYARVVGGVALEIVTIADADDIALFYTPEIVATFVACGANVQPNWTYNGAAFAAPFAPAVGVPPTADEIYDQTILAQQVLKGFALAFIAGTVTVGMTPAALKAAVKAKM